MKILWIDDDPYSFLGYVEYLRDRDIDVDAETNLKEGLVKAAAGRYDLYIVDLMLEDEDHLLDEKETHGGYKTGKAIARYILKHHPKSKVVCCSIAKDEEAKTWFNNHCSGFISKSEVPASDHFVEKITNIILGRASVRSFIVHGHDEHLLLELKDYITTTLRFPPAMVLRDMPSSGKTIIEKFEHHSDAADIVFVLLTPDDIALGKDKELRRARQNVIFELGYFLGKLGRKSGRILLIFKGELEIPTDIAGVVYLRTDSTINSISDAIRRELEEFFPKI
jgi:DNA-binding NarL/FixJ family response regulator